MMARRFQPSSRASSAPWPGNTAASYPRANRTGDQHDAFSIAAWLSQANQDGSLPGFLQPDLAPQEKVIAQVEGWILGVGGSSIQWGNLASVEVKGHA